MFIMVMNFLNELFLFSTYNFKETEHRELSVTIHQFSTYLYIAMKWENTIHVALMAPLTPVVKAQGKASA